MTDAYPDQEKTNVSQVEPSKQSTPIGKIFIGFLFILLPVVGFFMGRQSQPSTMPSKTENDVIETTPSPQPKIQEASPQMINQELNERCGDMPTDFIESVPSQHYTIVSGPTWSPDCRYIGYGVWQSGTSGPNMVSPSKKTGENNFEGLFVYSDKLSKTEKVYTPEVGETVEFVSWEDDSKAIIFKKDGITEFTYNLETRKVQ